ncbi:MAG: hypothetical protein O7B26_02740, partial [Planctomycetota bacterium]|nr:hypothetical protein [Planctomycetota bacterium]
SGIESSRALLLLDDDLGPVLIGLCAGAVGFLVHTSIDLAMFHPGSATTFFAILAIALAIREGVSSDQPRKPRPVAAVAVGVFGAIVVTAFVVGIVARAAGAGRLLETARTIRRDTTGGGIVRAGSDYAAAAEAYPLDGTALKEHADELLRRPIATQPGEHVRSVKDLLAKLEQRDPRNASLNAFLATIYYQAFTQGRDLADLDRALAAMRDAVADFPTSPNARIRLASLLVERAAATDSEDARRDAAREYRKALDLDARSIYVSKPHRYSEARRESIRVTILKLSEGSRPGVDQAASSVDGSPPTTTAPLPADRHRSLVDE